MLNALLNSEDIRLYPHTQYSVQLYYTGNMHTLYCTVVSHGISEKHAVRFSVGYRWLLVPGRYPGRYPGVPGVPTKERLTYA